jgi:hypothetical protein
VRKLLIFVSLVLSLSVSAQEKVVVHINAEFNKANDWAGLKSVQGVRIFGGYIEKNAKIKEKYNVSRVPTIILFISGKEVERWEAGLDMKLHVSQGEVQSKIDSY